LEHFDVDPSLSVILEILTNVLEEPTASDLRVEVSRFTNRNPEDEHLNLNSYNWNIF
jgi:hypothetical protein